MNKNRTNKKKESKTLTAWYVVIALSIILTLLLTAFGYAYQRLSDNEEMNPAYIYGCVMGGVFTGINLAEKRIILTVLSVIHFLIPIALIFA